VNRWLSRAMTVLMGSAFGLVILAFPAGASPAVAAHPLGNFTVNHYDGLHLYPERVDDISVIDTAEIPTLQAKASVDANHDGQVTGTEAATYAGARCAAAANAIVLEIAGRRQVWAVRASTFEYEPGAVNLQTSRLTCDLTSAAKLDEKTTIGFRNDFDSAGVGWHETTAVATGVALVDSPLPATSISDELRRYPNDLLSSPLNVRGANITVHPDGNSTYRGGFHVSGSNVFSRALNDVNTTFNGLVGRHRLTLGIGALAVFLAILLGAGHALLPGHGKTIMAAYLVGRRGRLRDVVAVGSTVTITHTAGVLVIGLLISVSSTFEPTSAERWLGVFSGLLVVLVGLTLLRSALRRRRAGTAVETGSVQALARSEPTEHVLVGASTSGSTFTHLHRAEQHSNDALTRHTHDHVHPHQPLHDGHSHGHQHGFRGHSHAYNGDALSRSSIIGLGVAGGLVPSPSALVVLLGTIALGRTAFGVLLVIAYGLGLALTLTIAGVLLVPLRHRAEHLRNRSERLRIWRYLDALPLVTAALVVFVGALLAFRSLSVY
jgi:nickel/cobalt exporter